MECLECLVVRTRRALRVILAAMLQELNMHQNSFGTRVQSRYFISLLSLLNWMIFFSSIYIHRISSSLVWYGRTILWFHHILSFNSICRDVRSREPKERRASPKMAFITIVYCVYLSNYYISYCKPLHVMIDAKFFSVHVLSTQTILLSFFNSFFFLVKLAVS